MKTLVPGSLITVRDIADVWASIDQLDPDVIYSFERANRRNRDAPVLLFIRTLEHTLLAAHREPGRCWLEVLVFGRVGYLDSLTTVELIARPAHDVL